MRKIATSFVILALINGLVFAENLQPPSLEQKLAKFGTDLKRGWCETDYLACIEVELKSCEQISDLAIASCYTENLEQFITQGRSEKSTPEYTLWLQCLSGVMVQNLPVAPDKLEECSTNHVIEIGSESEST